MDERHAKDENALCSSFKESWSQNKSIAYKGESAKATRRREITENLHKKDMTREERESLDEEKVRRVRVIECMCISTKNSI